MKLPHVRITLKRMMGVVAAVAVGLVLMREFEDGIPPRYVVRGIPARIGQLRPGMSPGQARKILGLEKSWIWGGTSTEFGMMQSYGNSSVCETYYVRQQRIGGTNSFFQASAMIRLRYHLSPGATARYLAILDRPAELVDEFAELVDESAQLALASFDVDGRTVAKMPGSW